MVSPRTDGGSQRRSDDLAPTARSIRVAQVVTSLAHGGAQETVLGTSRIPVERRKQFEVSVLAGGGAGAEPTLWGESCVDGLDIVAVPALVRRLSMIDDLRALRWLIRWLRANRPDVVHTHSSKAGVLGRLAAFVVGIPVVHTIHGWGATPVGHPLARRAVLGLERMLARITDRLVVVGEGDRRQGLAWGVGSDNQYRLIRSGIAISSDPVASVGLRRRLRRDLGLEDRFVVGMVARFSRQKDHDTLLRAVAEVVRTDLGPSLTLLLVGDGPTRSEVEATVSALGLADHVLFLGHRIDAAQLVHAVDVSVASSRWEGLPRTVLEAAAAGVPVVASNVGSVSDFVEHEHTGLLVEPGDATGLARAIISLGLSSALRARLADAASLRVREFSDDEMRSRTMELWLDVAGSDNRR